MTLAETSPMVSVIVCVFNDERHLDACLNSLLSQTYPAERREIILVDDGSTDGTADVAAKYKPVKYMYQNNQGPSTARNTGIRHACGDVILFTDSDCEAEPDWIAKLVEAITENTNAGFVAAGGRQNGHSGDPPFAGKVDRYLNAIGFIGDYVKPHLNARSVSHNASCNSAYLRRVLVEAGGFRPGMFPGEDVDLDRRLARMGYRVMFTPYAVVNHHRPDSKRRWCRMLMSYGRAQADNIAIHGFFRRIHFVPLLMVIAILVFAMILWRGDYVPAFIMIILGVISPVVWLKKRGMNLDWRDSLYFTGTTMFYYFWGFWRRMLQNTVKPAFSLQRSLNSWDKNDLSNSD